jgi:hypothetical protein
MVIIFWNIRGFGSNLGVDARWHLMKSVISLADLVFIFEGPKTTSTANAALEKVTDYLGTDWKAGYLITEAAQANETESLFSLRRTAVVTAMTRAAFTPTNYGGFRTPVLFTATGATVSGASPRSVTIMAWHAPPDGSNVGSAWGSIAAAVKAGTAGTVDIIGGDLNSAFCTPPDGYTDLMAARGFPSTMIKQPSLEVGLADSVGDIWAGGQTKCNDKIMVRNGFDWASGYPSGRINPAVEILGSSVGGVPGGGDRRSKRGKAPAIDAAKAHQIAAETSDHAPVMIVV